MRFQKAACEHGGVPSSYTVDHGVSHRGDNGSVVVFFTDFRLFCLARPNRVDRTHTSFKKVTVFRRGGYSLVQMGLALGRRIHAVY